MPHTKSKYEQDLGFSDGVLMAGLEDILALPAADAVRTRNAVADYSFNVAASKNVNFTVNVGQLMHRTGVAEDLQIFKGGTGIAGNADVQGRPPFPRTPTGKPLWLIPRTVNKLKGIKVTGFRFMYRIDTVDLTAFTARVDKVVYEDNVAATPTITPVEAVTNIYKVQRANTTVRTLTLTNPQYLTTDCSELILELNVQTNVGGAFRLYRIEVLFEYNYN